MFFQKVCYCLHAFGQIRCNKLRRKTKMASTIYWILSLILIVFPWAFFGINLKMPVDAFYHSAILMAWISFSAGLAASPFRGLFGMMIAGFGSIGSLLLFVKYGQDIGMSGTVFEQALWNNGVLIPVLTLFNALQKPLMAHQKTDWAHYWLTRRAPAKAGVFQFLKLLNFKLLKKTYMYIDLFKDIS